MIGRRSAAQATSATWIDHLHIASVWIAASGVLGPLTEAQEDWALRKMGYFKIGRPEP